MSQLHHLLTGILIFSTLFFSSCATDAEAENQNSPKYNILATVKKPVGLFSINIMELLKKSNIEESDEIPGQFRSIVNAQINEHLNSENQGFKLEGNIPFVVSATNDGDFDYVLSIFDVLDAEKITSSLERYLGEKVEKEGDVSLLNISIPLPSLTGVFCWDNDNMLFVLSKQTSAKIIAQELLKNKTKPAPENKYVRNFLAENNDITSTFFMDVYTKMINKVNPSTKMSDELLEAYEGTIVTAKGNFNDGDITFSSNVEGEKFLASKFNSFRQKPFDASFYNYLTDSGKLIAFFNAGLNLEALLNTFNNTMNEYSNYKEEMSKMGVTKENFTKILDGQFCVSLIDIEVDSEEELPKFLLTSGLKDIDQVKAIIAANGSIQAKENYFFVDDLYLGIYDHKLFVSLHESLIQQIVAGKSLATYKVDTDGAPFYCKLETNVDSLPKGFKTMLLKNQGEEILSFYNEITKFEASATERHANFYIEFSNQSVNSLELLTNAILKTIIPLMMKNMI